ncbi:hypothetical protein Patl1_03592 [Pistacia atlantica]|uniref:Uncharacterized protein n=1 Tax=Pistacia atlantica TaxID=434234 RepID=A0ACC1C501_9ROSI|nr:hypothetical protein Patl1_03592 [Pistacia atlantica]
MGGDPDAEQDASRLKTICETKFKNSNLKSALKYAKKAHRLAPNLEGISSMLTAFKILRVASKSSTNATTDWYKILQVEPFSHINTIKKQYKKLALILHPDKNSHLGCEEAFKLVGEGFRVLSDKIRRKEYDMRLRIRIQEENVNGLVGKDAFWTACSRCRLLHQFERKYLGHNLVCPSCNKSFEAVEVEGSGKMSGGDAKGKESGGDWSGGRLRRRMSTVGEVLARSKPKSVEDREILESLKPKRAKVREETMTLAQMQLEAKRRANQEKLKLKMKEKEKEKGREKKKEKDEREKERETGTKEGETETGRRRASKNQEKSVDLGTEKRGALKKSGNSEIARKTSKNCSLAIDRRKSSKSEDLEIMAVEDSDFYDFDKDRVERSFKKGQVWAIYDDDDGMPRHYGLIDEAISVYPFEVKISWLDLQNNGDEQLICWERMGFHVSCGRFKVSRKTSIDSLNIFSHVMDCERVAREIYRIYPKKGSVWALYNEAALGVEDRRSYDIVVFLTTYSEMHGLSMAYLEKVDGFKTIFKRREIGCHAIRWLEKDDVRLFSHQIPARKLTGDEVSDLLKDCWELDPASLPSDLLAIGWGR